MFYLIWAIAVLAVVLIWLRINKKLFDDVVSPFGLLLPAWILPLMLKSLRLSANEQPWSNETIAIVGWTTFSLVLTSILGAVFIRPKANFSNSGMFVGMLGLLEDTVFRGFVLFWFVIGFSGYIYNEFISNIFQIPILDFIAEPEVSHDAAWLAGKDGPLWPLSIPTLVLTPVLYLIFRITKSKVKRICFLILALAYPVMGTIKMSRADIIYAVVSIVMAEYYYRRYTSRSMPAQPRYATSRLIKRGILVFVIFALVLTSSTVFQEVRGGKVMADYMTVLGIDLDLPQPFDSVATEIYAYMALPFENLSSFVDSYEPKLHPGVGFLRPLFSIFGQGRIARDELSSIDFPLDFLPVNTSPFITVLYAESGWLGVILGPVLYALFINWIYLRFRHAPNFTNCIAYLMCPYAWLWIATCANFTGIIFYFYLVFPFFIYWQYKVLKDTRSTRFAPRPLAAR